MREIRTSGLMSGDGKRGNATAPVLNSTGGRPQAPHPDRHARPLAGCQRPSGQRAGSGRRGGAAARDRMRPNVPSQPRRSRYSQTVCAAATRRRPRRSADVRCSGFHMWHLPTQCQTENHNRFHRFSSFPDGLLGKASSACGTASIAVAFIVRKPAPGSIPSGTVCLKGSPNRPLFSSLIEIQGSKC